MPKVPTYDSPQVTPGAMPGAQQSSIASPALFDAGAQRQIDTGNALLKGGGEMVDVAVKMQERQDADRLFQAETSFKEKLIQFDTEQRSKKGASALAEGGITSQANEWFGKMVPELSQGLENDRQRKLFSQSAEKMRLQTLDSFSKHQATEARASLTDSTKATIKGSIDRAAANPSDWTIVETERGEIDKRLSVLAQLNGYAGDTPEQKAIRDDMRADMLTQLHKQVIQGLVKENPKAAVAYFDKYKDDIAGSQRAEIGEFAKKATSTSVGDGVAGAIWEADKPKSRTDPVTLDAMETKVRDQLKGNDDAIKVAIAGLRERASAYRDQRKEEAISLEAGVNALVLKGANTRQVLSSPEYLKLSAQSPEEARKIMTFLENKDYMAVARGAAAEQRADAAESRAQRKLHRDTLDTTLRLSDPDALVGLTRNEVVNLLPKLGSESTQALLQRWDSLTKSESKLKEARIDKQDFDTLAVQNGFRPNEKSKSEEEKDQLVRLQSKVENSIDAEQRARKRDLTRDEKKAIMQREIDDSIMAKHFFGDKKIPLGAASTEDLKNGYVVVGPAEQKVKLTDIPADFRAKAIASRKAQGLPTTEKQIGELWLRSKNQFKAN